MDTIKYTIIDLYYNKDEQYKADIIRKKLLRQGYELIDQDLGGEPFDYCDQFHKYLRCKILK